MPDTQAGSYANESSTSDHENCSDETADGPPNEHTNNSTPTALTESYPTVTSPTTATPAWRTSSKQQIDTSKLEATALSPRDQATLELIGLPLSEGWKEKELAAALGRPSSWVSEQLSNLRDAISLQQGIFPALSESEQTALTDSIAEHGVLEPVHVHYDGERLEILDGNHRCRIAANLLLSNTIRYILHRDLNKIERSGLEYTLNATRRQLDRRAKRKLVEEQLNLDATRSDRQIAAICGVHHETVGDVRRDLSDQWEQWNAPAEDSSELATIRIPENDHTNHPAPATSVAVTATATQVNNPAQTTPFTPTHRIDSSGRSQPVKRDHPHAPPEREWNLGSVVCPNCSASHSLIRVGERFTLRP